MHTGQTDIHFKQLRTLLETGAPKIAGNTIHSITSPLPQSPTSQVQLVNTLAPTLPMPSGANIIKFADGSTGIIQVAMGRIVRIIR